MLDQSCHTAEGCFPRRNGVGRSHLTLSRMGDCLHRPILATLLAKPGGALKQGESSRRSARTMVARGGLLGAVGIA